MIDSRLVAVPYKEPTVFHGRFVGAGASVPTKVANTSQKMTVARTGVGTLTVTLNDAVPPATTGGAVGVIEFADFTINSLANNKNAQVQMPAANAYVFNVQITYHANAVAVDLVATEELDVEVWTSRSAVP